VKLQDIPICNFIGQPFQWLTAMADMEYDSDPTPACVYSSAAPTLVKIERTSASTTVTAVDSYPESGHVESLARPILSPYARARLGL
jgi:hypothetical protein